MRILIALGGNAISSPDTNGDIASQFEKARETATALAGLLEHGHTFVLTHGNGPQVGNILRRVELSSPTIYGIPLDICVADTQAGMGYMLGQCLMNELRRRGHARLVTTIVTTVVVDPTDPAFASPSKPVGKSFERSVAEHLRDEQGWQIAEVAGGLWRRVVPSPRPQRVVEQPVIEQLLAHGELVIAAGGGGIPVIESPDGTFKGVEAVIDKDRTSAMLAHALGVDCLVIATAVDRVYEGFGTDAQRGFDRLSIGDANALLDTLPPGSMRPKVEAAAAFAAASDNGAFALICHLSDVVEAVAGRAGTRVG